MLGACVGERRFSDNNTSNILLDLNNLQKKSVFPFSCIVYSLHLQRGRELSVPLIVFLAVVEALHLEDAGIRCKKMRCGGVVFIEVIFFAARGVL